MIRRNTCHNKVDLPHPRNICEGQAASAQSVVANQAQPSTVRLKKEENAEVGHPPIFMSRRWQTTLGRCDHRNTKRLLDEGLHPDLGGQTCCFTRDEQVRRHLQ